MEFLVQRLYLGWKVGIAASPMTAIRKRARIPALIAHPLELCSENRRA